MAIQTHLGISPLNQDYFFLNNTMNNNNNPNFNNNNNNNINNNNGFLQSDIDFNILYQHQQQQQQQQQQYLAHLQNRNLMFSQSSKRQKLANNNTTTTTTTTTTTGSTTTSEIDNQRLMNVSQGFGFVVERQKQEIDRFINLQNERLRMVLQEQSKQQLISTIKKFEAKALELLKQKDDEIANATKKSIEFQQIISKLHVENQAWQRIALQNESIVISLNNTLSQLQQQQQQVCSSASSNYIDDAESCCDVSNIGGEKAEEEVSPVSETGENRGVSKNRNVCQNCHTRNGCVLMLPCKHLCCCEVCDSLVKVCPLCNSTKMASLEVLIS